MAAIQDFVLRIKVDGQDKIRQVGDQVKGLGTQIGTANQKLGDMVTNLPNAISKMGAFGLAVSAAGTAMAGFIGHGIKLGDELGDLADATDISAGALMNLRGSIIEAGGKAEEMAQIAGRLNQSVQEAAGGNEQLQKAFRTLGVFVTDAEGNLRSTDSILKDVTAKFKEGRLTGEEYAAAVDLLGKNIRTMDLTKLSAAGDSITDAQTAKITEFTGEIDKLKQAFDRLALAAGADLSERMTNFIRQTRQRLEETNNLATELEAQANREGRTFRSPGQPGQNLTDIPLVNPFFSEERLRREGKTGPLINSLLPTREFYTRPLTQEEKAFLANQQRMAELSAANAAFQPTRLPGAPGVDDAVAGGFGAKSEAQKKAEAEYDRRLQESRTQAATQMFLQGQEDQLQIARTTGNELTRIEAQLAYDEARIRNETADNITKERLRIFSQERLTEDEMITEFAAKSVELEQRRNLEITRLRNKAVLDSDKFRRDQMIKAFTEEEAQREQTRQELAAEEDLRRDALKTTYANIEALREANNETAQRNQFELSIVNLSERDQRLRRAAFDLDIRRQKALKDLANTANLTAEDRAQAEQYVNKEFERSLDLLAEQEGRMRQIQSSFADGWEKAFEKYTEDAYNASAQAQTLFQTATRGMEDAIVNFALTGKLSFRDMANQIIADIIRIQVRRSIAGFMGMGGFAGLFGGGGGEMAGAAVMGAPGFAQGGVIGANRPAIVGEKGPELFIPASSGNIIPNNQLQDGMAFGGTTVNYNISAVDAASFRQLVARDPQFIYNVTEAGRRSQPTRRLS